MRRVTDIRFYSTAIILAGIWLLFEEFYLGMELEIVFVLFNIATVVGSNILIWKLIYNVIDSLRTEHFFNCFFSDEFVSEIDQKVHPSGKLILYGMILGTATWVIMCHPFFVRERDGYYYSYLFFIWVIHIYGNRSIILGANSNFYLMRIIDSFTFSDEHVFRGSHYLKEKLGVAWLISIYLGFYLQILWLNQLKVLDNWHICIGQAVASACIICPPLLFCEWKLARNYFIRLRKLRNQIEDRVEQIYFPAFDLTRADNIEELEKLESIRHELKRKTWEYWFKPRYIWIYAGILIMILIPALGHWKVWMYMR